ncbi:unnamed protein product, partial [Nesidiocoris tenuis]
STTSSVKKKSRTCSTSTTSDQSDLKYCALHRNSAEKGKIVKDREKKKVSKRHYARPFHNVPAERVGSARPLYETCPPSELDAARPLQRACQASWVPHVPHNVPAKRAGCRTPLTTCSPSVLGAARPLFTTCLPSELVDRRPFHNVPAKRAGCRTSPFTTCLPSELGAARPIFTTCPPSVQGAARPIFTTCPPSELGAIRPLDTTCPLSVLGAARSFLQRARRARSDICYGFKRVQVDFSQTSDPIFNFKPRCNNF